MLSLTHLLIFQYGYGAYGYSLEPAFSSGRFSYLDRGVIYALAHIRYVLVEIVLSLILVSSGGGDLGRPWYEEGKLLKKKNSFTDFIACAKHLIEQVRENHNTTKPLTVEEIYESFSPGHRRMQCRRVINFFCFKHGSGIVPSGHCRCAIC